MAASDAVPSPRYRIADAIEEMTGTPAGDVQSVVIAYINASGATNAVTIICCEEHAMALMADAIGVLACRNLENGHTLCDV